MFLSCVSSDMAHWLIRWLFAYLMHESRIPPLHPLQIIAELYLKGILFFSFTIFFWIRIIDNCFSLQIVVYLHVDFWNNKNNYLTRFTKKRKKRVYVNPQVIQLKFFFSWLTFLFFLPKAKWIRVKCS